MNEQLPSRLNTACKESAQEKVRCHLREDSRRNLQAEYATGALLIFAPTQWRFSNTLKSHVDSRVKGSKVYLVRLTLGRVSLDVACTCPYFEKGEECKHVWATMLAADSRQYLTDVDARTRLSLVLTTTRSQSCASLPTFRIRALTMGIPGQITSLPIHSASNKQAGRGGRRQDTART